MLEGVSNLIGRKTITRTIDGRAWTFSVMVLADHAEKERYILSLKPDPVALMLRLPATTPASVRKSVEDAIVRAASRGQFVTQDEEAEFDKSLHGLAWSIWRALRDHHQEFGRLADGERVAYQAGSAGYSITPADGVQRALDLIEAAGNAHLKTFMDVRDGVTERTELGNSAGSAQPSQRNPTEADSPGLS
jgi:hypothetical protein